VAFYRFGTIASTCEPSAETIIALGFGLVTFLLACPACMASGFGAIAEIALALAMRVTRIGSGTVTFYWRLLISICWGILCNLRTLRHSSTVDGRLVTDVLKMSCERLGKVCFSLRSDLRWCFSLVTSWDW
jgi:hypothetical protein